MGAQRSRRRRWAGQVRADIRALNGRIDAILLTRSGEKDRLTLHGRAPIGSPFRLDERRDQGLDLPLKFRKSLALGANVTIESQPETE